MPALIALGRRWFVASDELFLPAFVGICLRTIWAIILSSCLVNYTHQLHPSCSHPGLMIFYLATATALIAAVIVVEACVMVVSMRGGVMQVEKRKSIPSLLLIRAFLFTIEIGLCSFGTYWCFFEATCASGVMLPIQLVTVSNWVLIAVTIIGVVVVFDPFGNEHSDKSMNDKLWEKRFKCISPLCCLQHPDTNHGAFEDIARILTSQFEDVDLVASDVAVGLMLVAHKQQTASYKRHRTNECSYEKQCSIYNFNNAAKRSAFKELTYYSVYAIGAYGWPLFMFIHPFTGCFNLCQECSIFNEGHEGDNICHSNHLALKKLSGLEDNDILYAEFGSSVYCPAFYISVDHDKQTIILSIRGTLSLQDVITDMVCDPEPIPGYPGFQAHKGMVMSAKNILKIIEEKDLLTIAFQLYPDFSLVVLGHSLGAGTATLLSFLLRPVYPTLKCFAYGPPGCLLCVNAMEESKKFVMSTIINKEFSSRLSMKSLGELRENVLAAIRTNTRPKWKLTLSQVLLWHNPQQVDNLFDDAEECPLIVPTLGDLENGQIGEETNLFPPGRIVFIHKNAPAIGCCSTDSSYEILEAPNNLFNTIEVSPEMLTDHLPDTLVTLLKDLQPLDVSAGDDI